MLVLRNELLTHRPLCNWPCMCACTTTWLVLTCRAGTRVRTYEDIFSGTTQPLRGIRYTNDMLSVSTPMFDTGGLYWRYIYGVMVACIIVPQFVLVCVGVLSSTPTAALTIFQVRTPSQPACQPATCLIDSTA